MKKVESVERGFTEKCVESRELPRFFIDSWFRRSKSRLAKAAGVEVAVQQRNKMARRSKSNG